MSSIGYNKSFRRDQFVVEDHPFELFIPSNSTHLIIGTFPTYKTNSQYRFFYSAKDNQFWNVMTEVLKKELRFNEGEIAVTERQNFLAEYGIGITDMHLKCYRKNKSSTDENLFPILLTDIFSILESHSSIKTLVFTSRTEIYGAWGLFKTYLLQRGLTPPDLSKRSGKLLEGIQSHNGVKYQIYVPYSTSPRLIKDGVTTFDELVEMYRISLGK